MLSFWGDLSREQKTGFVLLFVFALITVALGFFQFNNRIYGPFAVKIADPANVKAPINEEERLRALDTDRDGLNNFEEMTTYKTSAYLSDTDSDGIDDWKEIETGSDPLCGAGSVCLSAETALSTSTPISAVSPVSSDGAFLDSMLGEAFADNSEISDSLNLDKLMNDPVELRKLLAATGQIPADTLQKIADDDLLRLAREVFSTASSTGATGQ